VNIHRIDFKALLSAFIRIWTNIHRHRKIRRKRPWKPNKGGCNSAKKHGLQAVLWLSKNAQGAGGSSPCRVWAEPTFLVPQHFQESTASTEGARFAALTDKNELFRQAEHGLQAVL